MKNKVLDLREFSLANQLLSGVALVNAFDDQPLEASKQLLIEACFDIQKLDPDFKIGVLVGSIVLKSHNMIGGQISDINLFVYDRDFVVNHLIDKCDCKMVGSDVTKPIVLSTEHIGGIPIVIHSSQDDSVFDNLWSHGIAVHDNDKGLLKSLKFANINHALKHKLTLTNVDDKHVDDIMHIIRVNKQLKK